MSRLPFELFLILRYLRPKRTYVSIITLISIIGVMLGVAVLIVVISVMSGFDRQLREKMLGFNAHIKVSKPGGSLANYRELVEKISKLPKVRGVAPFIMGPVLVETQPADGRSQVMAPYLRGIEPRYETNVSTIAKSIIRGKFDVSNNGILIGCEFATLMNLEVGDPVAIISPRQWKQVRDSHKSNSEDYIMPGDYVVQGIFDVGYYDYNATILVTSLAEAQDLYDMPQDIYGLMVMLKDPMQVNLVRRDIQAMLGPDYLIKTWAEENKVQLDAIKVEKNVMFYILFFIMIVAAFGITSALITFVVQKTHEIGMLKALGATQRQIMTLFLGQSIFVGVLGVAMGFGLGMLAVSFRNEFLHIMNRLTGFELFPAEVYFFSELPALIVPWDIAIICGGSLIICILAGVLPAFNASRLRPVEALRYE